MFLIVIKCIYLLNKSQIKIINKMYSNSVALLRLKRRKSTGIINEMKSISRLCQVGRKLHDDHHWTVSHRYQLRPQRWLSTDVLSRDIASTSERSCKLSCGYVVQILYYSIIKVLSFGGHITISRRLLYL